ncbi:MAG: TonB-dependent receptor, partial [Chitinophagaceae bacterium]
MYRIVLCAAALLLAATLSAQHSVSLAVKNAETSEPLAGATVTIVSLQKGMSADTAGLVLVKDLPAGRYRIRVSHIGFEESEVTLALPYEGSQPYAILLHPAEEEEEEEVIIQSTRTSRSIRNVPTRVETIEMEEIDEKSNMRPANVAMLLHESTGIQVQQTSATSGNASIRIQGLDGRYTQLLKDGFASFGNFASGLSVLEIPPLDLKQVEIIKGPASTLYGGGAIAGVVNFISRTPGTDTEHNLLLNQSSIGQTNLGYFSSGRGKRTGYTLLGLVNNQQLFDVDKDDFTEVPRSFEFTVHPKLFIYNGNTTLIVGNSFTKGRREGGDVQVIKGKADATHRYFEENNTVRNITTLELQRKGGDNSQFTARQALSVFDRHIRIPGYHFHGASYSSFTDITWLSSFDRHTLVTGGNLLVDRFTEKQASAGDRDNTSLAAGAYVQDTWDASDKVKLESGLRFDWARYSNALFANSEFFVLPRVSLLIRYNEKLTSRIGAGLGYKVPTLFTERTETMQYQGVQQLTGVRSERSYGGTADINFKTRLGGDLDLSLNHMFFYTRIRRPLVLQPDGTGNFVFVNATEPVQSQGFETNAKFIYRHDFKLFLGYTFTDARADYLTGNQFLPLVPKHKINSALIYEKHDFLKLGLEAYYTSPQYLYNGFRTEG